MIFGEDLELPLNFQQHTGTETLSLVGVLTFVSMLFCTDLVDVTIRLSK